MGDTGLPASFTGPVTRVDASALYALGTLRLEGGKFYKYVKLLNETATVAGAAGDPVAFDAETGHETHTVVLDMDDAGAQPVGAGLLPAAVNGTVNVAEYCWIQLTGPATVPTAIGGTPADGDALIKSTTDKELVPASAADSPAVAYGLDVTAKKIMCAFPL